MRISHHLRTSTSHRLTEIRRTLLFHDVKLKDIDSVMSTLIDFAEDSEHDVSQLAHHDDAQQDVQATYSDEFNESAHTAELDYNTDDTFTADDSNERDPREYHLESSYGGTLSQYPINPQDRADFSGHLSQLVQTLGPITEAVTSMQQEWAAESDYADAETLERYRQQTIQANNEAVRLTQHATENFDVIERMINRLMCAVDKRAHYRKAERLIASLNEVKAENIDDGADCVVCHGPLKEESWTLGWKGWKRIVRLPCHQSQILHQDCLQAWLEASNKCPFDKTDLF